ncbi:MAG: hypothetical protein PVH17_03380 [Anaerolineae bacterium]|jgi:hypothetical protein
MPVDVRINEVTTTVDVTDASAMLTPQILDQITREVLRRLEVEQRAQQETDQERSVGASRSRQE